MMNSKDEEQLKLQIEHIFDSGANEIRVFEMVKYFINRRYMYEEIPVKRIYDIITNWELYKKQNWWESDSVDVEKVLLEKFLINYK